MKSVEPGQVWRERDSRFISRHILVVQKLDVERVACVPCDADGKQLLNRTAQSGRMSKIRIKNMPRRFDLVSSRI